MSDETPLIDLAKKRLERECEELFDGPEMRRWRQAAGACKGRSGNLDRLPLVKR